MVNPDRIPEYDPPRTTLRNLLLAVASLDAEITELENCIALCNGNRYYKAEEFMAKQCAALRAEREALADMELLVSDDVNHYC